MKLICAVKMICRNTGLLSRLTVVAALLISTSSYAQQKTDTLPDGTEGVTFTARKADTVFINEHHDLKPNEFEGTHSTFRIGLGYIGDFTTYAYDGTFQRQLDSLKVSLDPTFKTRDFRILGSGRFLKTKRYIAWKFAYMYDGNEKVWMMRETGITIGVPELAGHIFVGRTKEGFSMIKVMNGHSGVTNERQMALDPIPILADGIKWFGYLPKPRLFWNLGYYNDILSKGQSFSTFAWQYVARIGWMPISKPKENTVLHIAANLRYAKPLDGKFTIKSRPESNPTPQLINTGQFAADKSTTMGGEVYYNRKRFMIGSEVMMHNFYTDKADDHSFYGGEMVVSYLFTGGSRPYNTIGSVFGFVKVNKSIFKGGLGAIEGVIRASTFNLNDGAVKGGQMYRLTPMINWYLSQVLRWELVYGYGILDRFNLKGHVNFFETRIQLTVM
jgi:phosphate-selective porin OprO and OprP